MKYDAIINGQSQDSQNLLSDFADIRSQAVMSGQHELDLSELDKNIRSLINMMDNKFKDQAMTIRALKDQQGQLESQQEKQGDTIEDQIIALEKVAASVVANNNNNRIDLN